MLPLCYQPLVRVPPRIRQSWFALFPLLNHPFLARLTLWPILPSSDNVDDDGDDDDNGDVDDDDDDGEELTPFKGQLEAWLMMIVIVMTTTMHSWSIDPLQRPVRGVVDGDNDGDDEDDEPTPFSGQLEIMTMIMI